MIWDGSTDIHATMGKTDRKWEAAVSPGLAGGQGREAPDGVEKVLF